MNQKPTGNRNGASQSPPSAGTPEGAVWFRAELEALGLSQIGFAKWMKRRGDDRQPATILRHVQRLANGDAQVSGEMRVILGMMRRSLERQRREQGDDLPPSP